MEYTKERLQELLQNMLGAMVIYQVQGERFVPFLYTATVPGYSGMTEEEYLKLYGQDSLPIVAPSDRPALQGLLKQVVEQDGSCEAVFRINHKKLGFIWTHMEIKLLGTCQGWPVLLGLFNNVTDTLAVPGKLLDHSNEKIYVIERNSYELLYSNAVAQGDKSRKPVLGQTCYHYIRGLGAPCSQCIVNQIQGEKPLDTEWYDQVRHKRYAVRAVPMTFFNKQAYALFINDLTNHVQLEEALREERERYRAATEGANLRVYEYSILDHTITLPEHVRQMFGHEDAVLHNVPEALLSEFQEEDYDRARQFFARVDRGEKVVSDEFLMKPVKGRAAYLRFTFTTAFDYEGRPVKAYAVAEDITAQKMEEAAKKRERAARKREMEAKKGEKAAQQANAAKSEFLSRMSHDIRTPLNGIMGLTYLARQQENTPQMADYLQKIDISSKFLLGLINEVLDMSKAESGKLELHPEPYYIDDFKHYMDSVIRPLCEKKHQNFVFEIKICGGAEHNFVPLLDKLRINQVYFNILSNAVKCTPEGGTITVKLQEHLNEAGHLVIEPEISDTGVGMTEEFQKILFEPFTQEYRNDTDFNRGTGLGLSIVKRILDQMGATITVQSKLNQGTTFKLRLECDCVPVKTREVLLRREKDELKLTQLRGRRLLLVEDHPLNQQIGRALLSRQGILVEVANNGQEGVEFFKRSPAGYFDAILMDIRMPVMDGYEAAAALRALDRADARTIPIIAMTADAFAEDVQRCLAAGMNRHIAKPIDPAVLYRTLAEVVSNPDLKNKPTINRINLAKEHF